jgi:hypothetical protein
MRVLSWVEDRVNGWLTTPEANAAGRMSLYRILFGLAYLWVLSPTYHRELGEIPLIEWQPLTLVNALFVAPPGTAFYEVFEALLVVSLVLLIVGFRTRLATLGVLVFGLTLDMLVYSFGKVSHGSVFLTFYVPLFMLFSHWGSNYSVDSFLRRRHGEQTVSPNDSSWRFIWPARAILVMLALLFLTAGYTKLQRGYWLRHSDFVRNLILQHNVLNVTERGFPASAFGVLVAQSPLIYKPMRYMAVLFETLFPLALLHRRLGYLFITLGIAFHAFNAFALMVIVPHMLIIYGVFVDWQALYERFWPKKATFTPLMARFSTPALIAGIIGIAFLIGWLWNGSTFLRPMLSSINPMLIWIVVTPIALVWLIHVIAGLTRDILAGLSGWLAHFRAWYGRRVQTGTP